MLTKPDECPENPASPWKDRHQTKSALAADRRDSLRRSAMTIWDNREIERKPIKHPAVTIGNIPAETRTVRPDVGQKNMRYLEEQFKLKKRIANGLLAQADTYMPGR